jgi:hypothetical protein
MILTGCGPAIMPAAAPETESGETFVIALPRIVLTFDETGKPGVEGLPIEQIARSLGYPLDLSAYRMDPAYVNWMTASNIQHVEVRQTGSGLALLANGKLMPSIKWEDGSLETAAELVRWLGPQNEQLAGLLQRLAPVAKRLGISVVLRFPLQAGGEAIPLATDEIVMATPVAADGPASAVMQFEIKYDELGVPSIMGISARDLAEAGLNAPLALHPYYVEQAQSLNIQYLQLRSKGDGLYIYLNGAPLPAISWDKNALDNTLDLVQKLYAVYPIDWELIKQFEPLLSNTDISILLNLPRAEGAAAIPITVH